MANEDIIKKDLVMDLKNMQKENNMDNLEPVNLVIGRYQPFTIGHLGMAKELKKENDLPSVYVYVRSKSGNNKKFSDNLTNNYMDDVVQSEDLVRDAFIMESGFIPVIIKEAQRRGYNPVLLGAGEDRAKSYKGMIKRMKEPVTHPDFDVKELKGRLTSATEVRNAIMDGDEKKFKKLTPKAVHPYYPQLKGELEKSNIVKESMEIVNLFECYSIADSVLVNILEEFNEDLFSDNLVIEMVIESVMSDIHLLAQEAKDFKTFKKFVKKQYPTLGDDDIKQLYDDVVDSLHEAKDHSMKIGKRVTIKKYNPMENRDLEIDATIDDVKKMGNKYKVTYSYNMNGKDKTATVDGNTFDKILVENMNEAALSPDAKKMVKGKKKINISKIADKIGMPGVKALYLDETDGKYYFVDFEGDIMELKNEWTLKELKKSLNESLNEAKLKFKGDYPIYHDSYSSALDAVSDYVENAGYSIDDDDFYSAFGDAFFKPKKGKTQRKSVTIQDNRGNGNPLGTLHVQIYNRGTDGNPYELNMYHDGIRKGLKESEKYGIDRKLFKRKLKELSTTLLKNTHYDNNVIQEFYDLVKDFFEEKGIHVFENAISINHDSIFRSWDRVFESVTNFRNGDIGFKDLETNAEKETIPYLAKFESKITEFSDSINEMYDMPGYDQKIEAALALMVKTNQPYTWESFKQTMVRSEFLKKEFRPFLMRQGLSDYQIDRFVDNLLKVKYQHYTNYYLGNPGRQYL